MRRIPKPLRVSSKSKRSVSCRDARSNYVERIIRRRADRKHPPRKPILGRRRMKKLIRGFTIAWLIASLGYTYVQYRSKVWNRKGKKESDSIDSFVNSIEGGVFQPPFSRPRGRGINGGIYRDTR